MTEKLSWREKRMRIESDLTDCFPGMTGIGKKDFSRIFFHITSPSPIGDFNSQYLAGEKQLEEIFIELAEKIGLNKEKVASHYDRNETFSQFGEHLLRSGAYKKTEK